MSQRKVIHTSVTTEESVIATCDDGTVWRFPLHNWPLGWEQLPPIPQPTQKEGHWVTINGRKLYILDNELSYRTICTLADYNPERTLSVVYSILGTNTKGMILPEKSIPTQPNLIIDVADTSNA